MNILVKGIQAAARCSCIIFLSMLVVRFSFKTLWASAHLSRWVLSSHSLDVVHRGLTPFWRHGAWQGHQDVAHSLSLAGPSGGELAVEDACLFLAFLCALGCLFFARKRLAPTLLSKARAGVPTGWLAKLAGLIMAYQRRQSAVGTARLCKLTGDVERLRQRLAGMEPFLELCSNSKLSDQEASVQALSQAGAQTLAAVNTLAVQSLNEALRTGRTEASWQPEGSLHARLQQLHQQLQGQLHGWQQLVGSGLAPGSSDDRHAFVRAQWASLDAACAAFKESLEDYLRAQEESEDVGLAAANLQAVLTGLHYTHLDCYEGKASK